MGLITSRILTLSTGLFEHDIITAKPIVLAEALAAKWNKQGNYYMFCRAFSSKKNCLLSSKHVFELDVTLMLLKIAV
jgi:hypothetical protein